MSFKDLKVEDLRGVAETFGVELTKKTKLDIIDQLEAEGVTFEQYEAFVGAEKVEPEDQPERLDPESDDTLLIKMDRGNTLFGFGEYQFSQEHPFVLMKTDDAERIMSRFAGFRIATPSEAKSYYS